MLQKLTLAADRVQDLQEKGLEKLLGRNARTPDLRVDRVEIAGPLGQSFSNAQLSGYQSLSGLDGHSISADPLFAQPGSQDLGAYADVPDWVKGTCSCLSWDRRP